jgi:2-amino-4-hydroxy-6-hydroxymethyldihydropteridine diphosphokinase
VSSGGSAFRTSWRSRGKTGLGETIFLGLGSNLGDRVAALRQGLRTLEQGGVRVLAVSPLVETSAIGLEDQPPFVNLVAACSWKGGPEALLKLILQVEEGAGRTRPFANAPRTLDIDLLFFGEDILRVPGIQVPHPRWRGRRFVVQPLRALAPDLVDPETGLTVEEIARIWPQEPKEIRELGSGEALFGGRPGVQGGD